MKYFKNLRRKIGAFLVKRSLKAQTKRAISYNDLKSAKSIGILFDATHQERYFAAKNFIENLRNSQNSVLGLGFVTNHVGLTYFPQHDGIDFISLENTNWYFKPLDRNIDKFQNKNFDVFIDLNTEEVLQCQFIVASTKAKLRIGRGRPDNSFYDLLIDLKEGIQLDHYLNQIIYYMSKLQMKSA